MIRDFLIELSNGVCMVLAASLAVICAVYIRHEAAARPHRRLGLLRFRYTTGMRIAIATGALSIGISFHSAVIFFWCVSGGRIAEMPILWPLVGTVVSSVGFVCAIREKSRPLYGPGPWIWALSAATALVVVDCLYRFWPF